MGIGTSSGIEGCSFYDVDSEHIRALEDREQFMGSDDDIGSMSNDDDDPWDVLVAAEPEQFLETATWAGPEDAPKATEALSTLPRCTRGARSNSFEQMPPNSWCQGWGEDFRVRQGPRYQETGLKVESKPCLYNCVGIDVYHSAKPIRNIGSKIRVPVLPFAVPGSVPGVLVVNIQLPTHKQGRPWVMKKPKAGDGDSVNVVLTYVMRRSTMLQMQDMASAPPALHLLEQYFMLAPKVEDNGLDGKGDFRGRCKLIAQVTPIPRAIASFNGRPALVTDDGRLYMNGTNATMDININDWALPVRTALYSMGGLGPGDAPGKMSKAKVKLAICIEPREDELMPEQVGRTL